MKNPNAVALGRKGGKAATPAQLAQRKAAIAAAHRKRKARKEAAERIATVITDETV